MAPTKTVYQVDAAGRYVGPAVADESPLEKGVFLIPAGCVENTPPDAPAGKMARYVGGAWVLEDLTQPEPEPEPGPVEPSVDDLRRAAYIAESDPLFFKWQRSEASQQEWLDKVAEIRGRYPE